MSILKKGIAVVALTTVGLYLAAPSLLGFSLQHLPSAVRVATSMGAKIGCSGRYISGFSHEKMIDDLATYSPVNRQLDLSFDDESHRVTASLFGMAPVQAQYRPQLGCTLIPADGQSYGELTVEHGTSNPDMLWPAGSKAELKSNYQTVAESVFQRDNEQGLDTRALVVIKGGKLVAEVYGEGVNADTPLLGWSMAKSVTAMMLARWQQMSGFDLEQTRVFDAWEADMRNTISMKDLLTMTSGLDFDETYAPGSDATNMLFEAPRASDIPMNAPLKYKAGSHFSYSSGTTNLLSRWLFEQLDASPQKQLDFLYQELFQPLSIHNAVFEMDPSGVLVGSSYLYASGRDWARLGQLMLDMGQVRGQPLLPRDWVEQASQSNHSSNDPSYGYQFWLNRGKTPLRWPELPEDAYAMLGNRKQVVMIVPSADMVIVRLGWSTKAYPTGANFAQLLAL